VITPYAIKEKMYQKLISEIDKKKELEKKFDKLKIKILSNSQPIVIRKRICIDLRLFKNFFMTGKKLNDIQTQWTAEFFMQRLLLTVLAFLALPTSVNATNYVECEAIYSLIVRTENQKEQRRRDSVQYPDIYSYNPKIYDEVLERAYKDYDKRGCYGL